MQKRANKIQVLLTDEELSVLDRLAAQRGLKRSALLRSLLLDKAAEWGGTTTPPHVVIGHWSGSGSEKARKANQDKG